MKRILLLAGVALCPLAARAQLKPDWTNGYKPQASEWNTLWSNALDARTLGQPNSAALLDAAGTLSANQVLGTGTTTPLTLANAAVQRLDPHRFGALCNGSTDDQAAFNQVTTYINAQSSSLVRTNTAWEIDIAGGRCLLSQPWTLTYGSPNISVHIHGDGSAHSELEWTGGTNGIVVSFAANANGNEMARGTTYPGQGIAVDGLHFIAANGSTRAGTALTVNGIPLTNASNPPFQRYSDLVFGNDNGYSDNTVNWAGGMYLVNPDNVNARDLMWWDQAHQSNTTSIPFWLHSTAPAGGPGHGNITFDNITAQGGGTGFQIDGNAFQGINISHLFTVFVQTAVSWVVNPNTLSGSLTLDHSSLSAQQTIVTLANVSTFFSDDNFYYNVNPPAGHNFYALSSLGGDTIQSHGDTFVGPAAGAMGSGYKSQAIVVFSPSTFDPQGSVISGDSVAGFDVGYTASGGPISFKDDRAASTTMTCYQDAGAQASSALHPDFDGISCGQELNKNDGKGLSLLFDWAVQRYVNGSLELGMPGATSPGGVAGYTGQIDWHITGASSPSSMIDYDYRETLTASTGSVGGGTLLHLGARDNFTGGVFDHSAPRVAILAGATVQAANNTTGIELAPGGTIASGTLDLPLAPQDGDTFNVGTEQTITAFTVGLGSGTAATQINGAPTSITAQTPVRFKYYVAVTTWDRY